MTDPIYFGAPTLRTRGWTATLIARFLATPDELAPNPHYRSGPPRRLYLITRVEAIEATDAWQIARQRSAPRRQATQRAVATKRHKTVKHAESVTFNVPVMERGELIQRACRAYNRRMAEYDGRITDCMDWKPATPESDPRFLERIIVNFLRHGGTRYDEELDEVRGRVGVDTAYQKIVAAVLDAIAEAYPWLGAECGRQKALRVAKEQKA